MSARQGWFHDALRRVLDKEAKRLKDEARAWAGESRPLRVGDLLISVRKRTQRRLIAADVAMGLTPVFAFVAGSSGVHFSYLLVLVPLMAWVTWQRIALTRSTARARAAAEKGHMQAMMLMFDLQRQQSGGVVSVSREATICPQCSQVSHNPNNVKHRYCGACHQFYDQMPGAAR